MLIDPFTIIAQIVNFAILVFALKHFLYDRVLDAVDEREAMIAARLRDAEERESSAARAADDFEARRRELEDRQQDLLAEARTEATRHRAELLEDARGEVDELRDRWHQGLRAEQRETEQELRRRTADEVVELSRHALRDVAGVDLEAVVIDLALDHLSAETATLDEVAGPGFTDSDATDSGATAGSAPLVIRTAFEVSPANRRRVADRLHAMGLASTVELRFERNEHLILGVEFDGRGTAVSWHADDYLERLDDHIQRLILETDGPSESAKGA